MTHLTHEDKITLGQCFNLAHAEMLLDKTFDDAFLLQRTIELFELKRKIDYTLKQNIEFPLNKEGGS